MAVPADLRDPAAASVLKGFKTSPFGLGSSFPRLLGTIESSLSISDLSNPSLLTELMPRAEKYAQVLNTRAILVSKSLSRAISGSKESGLSPDTSRGVMETWESFGKWPSETQLAKVRGAI